ncbi:glycosyltransferase family 2 protein [Flavihumibacter stibioxidans]|uniref:Glycosyl transferase n=1 Tax=Flavihumibacter stibioxidans TaxID=1834163 RepID=A0ABR7M7K6_9BACT|nr:glycosyltransferase family 2 protein [Flavihumibacter stibioxidans]MBC6491013.1 glycosyl transferase [Flavihumibacter stibioxidans]
MCTISVITATYNSAATVEDTLISVGRQTYPYIEHIIIDGKSTDQTLDLVARHPHVAKLISEPDKGIYDAMNKGITLASGDVVGILNSDDIYAHNRVLEYVARLFKDPDVQAVYSDLQYVKANNLNKVVRYWKSGEYSSQNFFYGWMPPHPTFFVRKQLYDDCGVFDTSFKSAADYELMLRFLVRYNLPAAYLPEVTVKMRVGGMSNASLTNRWRANREDRRAWDINGLTPYFFTIPLKPFRKLTQFLIK